ncbi:hypothetical protein LZ32DRAFT_664372 [Colletotrichum eremochloae]|nr:hypothetical protein LZ32DRAFT_664372 [Colletotrichum eremochloae]
MPSPPSPPPAGSQAPAPGPPTALCDTGRTVLDRLGVAPSFRRHRIVAVLSCSPVMRDLVPRKQGKALPITYSHRTISVLVQVTGFAYRPPCDRCARGNGPWAECVGAQTAEAVNSTKGACANCVWANQGSLCSMHRAFSSRTAPDTSPLSQPAETTLADCLPAFDRWQSEVNVLGKPWIIARSSTYVRMTASELTALYDQCAKNSEFILASISNLSEQHRELCQQMSEITLMLSLLRAYDGVFGTGPRDASADPVTSGGGDHREEDQV